MVNTLTTLAEYYFKGIIWASLPESDAFCDMMIENSNFLNVDDIYIYIYI